MNLKTAWDTSLDNATELVKQNKVITGIVVGGISGTILFPIPIVGTVLGAIVGAKIAEKIEKDGEHKMKKVVVVELKGSEPDVYLATEVEEEDIENLQKLGVKVVEADTDTVDTEKKKFAFLVPAAAAVWAVLPTTATVVGAGVIGIVGGAASIVGGKLVNKIWK